MDLRLFGYCRVAADTPAEREVGTVQGGGESGA